MNTKNYKSCSHCGNCCSGIPCGIGLTLLGDYRPCIALEEDDGLYWCGLVRNPNKYLNLDDHTEWKSEFISTVVKEYNLMGCGCGESIPMNIVYNDIRNGLLRKSIKSLYSKNRAECEF